jgi:carbamoyl-phosphate synthase large subunit
MPRRTDIQRVMILGSGPIKIGQAAEFDFSGSQACRALREDGFEVILVNSNPATIQNDPEMADRVYIEPLLPDVVRRILELEKPDAILAGMGGQTALNIASELAHDGTLERLGIELIGSDLEAIDKAEDRNLFKKVCESIGLPVPHAIACESIEEYWPRPRNWEIGHSWSGLPSPWEDWVVERFGTPENWSRSQVWA